MLYIRLHGDYNSQSSYRADSNTSTRGPSVTYSTFERLSLVGPITLIL